MSSNIIFTFITHLLSAYYVPGSTLSTEDWKMIIPIFKEIKIEQWEKWEQSAALKWRKYSCGKVQSAKRNEGLLCRIRLYKEGTIYIEHLSMKRRFLSWRAWGEHRK